MGIRLRKHAGLGPDGPVRSAERPVRPANDRPLPAGYLGRGPVQLILVERHVRFATGTGATELSARS